MLKQLFSIRMLRFAFCMLWSMLWTRCRNISYLFSRKTIRYFFAILIAMFVARYFSFTQGFWIPLTTAIVLQGTLGSTLRKGLQRFVGTILGILLGTIFVLCFHNMWVIQALLVITLFVAYYLKACNILNYGIFVVPLSAMVVMLVSVLVPAEAHALIWARCYDTTIGALIAVVMAALFFPQSQLKLLKLSVEKTEAALLNYYAGFMKGSGALHQARLELEESLSDNRTLYADAFYELMWMPKRRLAMRQFIDASSERLQLFVGLEGLFQSANENLKIDIMRYTQRLSKGVEPVLKASDELSDDPSMQLWRAYLMRIAG